MRAITDSLKGNFDRGWEFLNELIKVCPDSVWTKKGGGFVFWQQLYHCFFCVSLFVLPKDSEPQPGPWGLDVAKFKSEPTTAPSKEELKTYADKKKAEADAWIATLDDAKLTEENAGLSARFGAPMNNAMALAIMSGHSSYHIGSCDAVLRDNGEKGVM
ncbi:hypothetical protein AGMMS50276_20030 [Synergistales bacterium]|nr:hypothetical protein AGMMS50276_20030 [Synergistales bacterium]